MNAAPLLRASLLAALTAALLPLPANADSRTVTGPGGLSARARLDFQVRIPAVAQVQSAGHGRLIEIRGEDIERGYVEVAGARIAVKANMRGQKRLVAQVTAAFAKAVEIAGLPQPLVAQPAGESALQDTRRGVVDRLYDVSYRIQLAPGIAPGVYPWPVFLRVDAA
ncbi:MAG: hypothetical protein FIB05_11825 [Betaproteobacteria bacterium]|nr:hypothetical protein [Betaproteobacteria bacterium]PWB62864.1 MAG: hypothetical protein C3F16_05970 [Betaproteobacteria bacterium]